MHHQPGAAFGYRGCSDSFPNTSIRSCALLSAHTVAGEAELEPEAFLIYSETGSRGSGLRPAQSLHPALAHSFPGLSETRGPAAVFPSTPWNVFFRVTVVAENSKHLKQVGWVLCCGFSPGCPQADVASGTAPGPSARGGQGLQSRW